MGQKKPSKTDLNDPVTKHVRRDFTRRHVGQSVGEALASLAVTDVVTLLYFDLAGWLLG